MKHEEFYMWLQKQDQSIIDKPYSEVITIYEAERTNRLSKSQENDIINYTALKMRLGYKRGTHFRANDIPVKHRSLVNDIREAHERIFKEHQE